MAFISLLGSKAILAVCNFLLLACGFSLITAGMLVLFDTDRILLSKLLLTGPLSTMPQPLLHYVAIGLASMGLILASTGILGCWASCMHSYYMLAAYFLIIILALICECVIYAVAWAWPSCLGLGIDSMDLTKTVQRNYGTVGEEQFTAAFDLAQTLFQCCGVESANEYDTGLWQLQGLGPPLVVPLTCCKLLNPEVPKAFLDPKPFNTTLCQALEKNTHEGYRHMKGCIDAIHQWYHEHYLIFLGIGLVVVIVEFLVVLSTILTCTKLFKHKQEIKAKKTRTQVRTGSTARIINQDTYQRRPSPLDNAYSNDTYAMTNSFRQNYKLVDRA